jgi:hypothetical protein
MKASIRAAGQILVGLAALSIAASLNSPLHAQAARSGGGADNARVVQQMQQLASERTALQADNAKLKEQLADLQKKLDQATADVAASTAHTKGVQQQELARAADSKKQAEEANEKLKTQMRDLVVHFRETAQDLKNVEVERNEFHGKLEARNREYATCVDRNVGLYQTNIETLDRLDKHGFWSKAADTEPFTQLSRARLENLIDAYRYRIDELRLEQKKSPAPAKSPAGM